MRNPVCVWLAAFACEGVLATSPALADTPVRGEIVDAATGERIPARIYIRAADGRWFFPRSDDPAGTAVEYRRERQTGSVEMHTTLSAHPFRVDLPPGRYTVTVERGKEYVPAEQEWTVGGEPVQTRIPLRRWTDMAARGWYSGDTHVHRTLAELPNVMRAEDLNIALPLTFWVTRSHTPPTRGDKAADATLRPEPTAVDSTHVIYPINTEYEIFTVGGKPHTLGAVFVLGHRMPLGVGVPPLAKVTEHARREGALLDLDKHSWPWSLVLVPIMNVDLFELANNHVWRTQFGFRRWTIETLPAYMKLETMPDGFTEWGWIDFGFQTYYALLNCGFRMRPTAGTASGVHPVPLGFGRVYVHLPDGFDYRRWMDGLNAGRSFVTTGPMLFVEFNGRDPGQTFRTTAERNECRVTGTVASAMPIDRIEFIVNGRIARTIRPKGEPTRSGGHANSIDERLTFDGSSWVAVRAFERHADGRVRFAHTAPVYFDVPGRPLRPSRDELDYLAGRVRQEIERSRPVLSKEELDEYHRALEAYERIGRGLSAP